jgi:Universal stress protein family
MGPVPPTSGPAEAHARRAPWLVVGVGPTRESRGALLWALREAERRDGTVLAVTVWDGGPEDERAVREAELVARVRDAVQETGVRGRTQVQLVVGSVAAVLTELSEEADVLVVGPHHRLGWAG